MPTFKVIEYKTPKTYFTLELEVAKNLACWSLAKGIQDDPMVKRLAIRINKKDDSKFEVWDEGKYIVEVEITKGVRKQIKDKIKGERAMIEGIKSGEIKFSLIGKKINASYALIKTHNFPPGQKNAWLLIKHK